MAKRWFRSLLVGIPVVGIALIGGAAMLAGGSAGGTLQSGRSVTTYSDSIYLISTSTKDTETIQTARKTILVKPTALVVDGIMVARIDEDVADVRVHVERGEVTFVADGTQVETVQP